MRGAVFPKFGRFGANRFFHRKGTDDCFTEFGLLEGNALGLLSCQQKVVRTAEGVLLY